MTSEIKHRRTKPRAWPTRGSATWPGHNLSRASWARAVIAFVTVVALVGLVVALLPGSGSEGDSAPAAAADFSVGDVSGPDPEATEAIALSRPWSDPATWDGKPPQAGKNFTVPKGKSVLLDVSPPDLGVLTIDGSLTFADKNLTLRADSVVVNGTLRVGTTKTPFRKRARIVLTETSRKDITGAGPKALAVMGGRLELHGENRPGWTRLGATATPGSRKLVLDKNAETDMGWRAGDRIAVASSDFGPDQAEEFDIASVDGATVTLKSPIRRTHWGTVQQIAGRSLDERAEVALLSRNISVEGDQASSAGGFGGQTMIMGTARIDGVEFTRMGQRGELRRYPVHFHMNGSAKQSYVKNSSISHSFNRCLVVHGTNDTLISGNVCYDHIGHGFFLEDGAETRNTLENNLGFGTRKPAEGQALLPSDREPATFWLTNPDNVVRGNVAAGSEGHGFWMALPENPTGLSRTTSVWPRRTPLGEFSDNRAHSNDRRGLNVDNGPTANGETEVTSYRPVARPADQKSKPVIASFESFTAYKNRDHGVWLRGSNHRLDKAVLADNAIGATFASDETLLTNSFVVGESANMGTPRAYEKTGAGGRALPKAYDPAFPIRGYEFYDGRVGAENTTFANFSPTAARPASALGYKLDNAFPISTGNYAKSLRFVDANRMFAPQPVAGKDGDAAAVFQDRDGSVTGTTGSYVAANNAFLHNNTCRREASWNASVCRGDLASVRIASLTGPAPIKPLLVRRSDGVTQTLRGPRDDSSEANTTVFAEQRYDVAFAGETPARSSFVLRDGQDSWVEFSVPMAATPRVTRYGCDVSNPKTYCFGGNPTSPAAMAASKNSTYFYDAAAKRLYLRIVGREGGYEELQVQPI